MKALQYVAWAAGIAAVIVMILGGLALISGSSLFGFNKVVNYFHVANSFLLLAICCLLYRKPS
ncbi:MAG: hypothetical protein JW801_15620 [Bacteroidales bacterium]|nr:hypothetical protein [Bacteroidales bacterium]